MRKVAIRGDARQIASTAEDSANSRTFFVLWRFVSEVVGATGFEPATPCAQGRCATRLRYAPTLNCFILDHLPGLVPAHLPFLSQNPRIDRPVSKPQLDSRLLRDQRIESNALVSNAVNERQNRFASPVAHAAHDRRVTNNATAEDGSVPSNGCTAWVRREADVSCPFTLCVLKSRPGNMWCSLPIPHGADASQET